MSTTFLTARWRYLAMINYAVDPGILAPLVPRGTELDDFNGTHYASLVGFRFLDTRVLGIGIPFHRNFDEVNLRFYVRHRAGHEWRRGVVFVREIVPRFAIAAIARLLYGEPYAALPMRHAITEDESALRAEYCWRRQGNWEILAVTAEPTAVPMAPGSQEEFIAEHYWGYTDRRGRASEYQVEHPRWRVWPGRQSHYEADVATLYGPQFVEALSASPRSCFIAEGSPVRVRYWSDPTQAGKEKGR